MRVSKLHIILAVLWLAAFFTKPALAADLVPGYSYPALQFDSITDFSDEFNNGVLDGSVWSSVVSSGATGTEVVVDTGFAAPPGSVPPFSGLAAGLIDFPLQSIQVSTSIRVLSGSQGDYCAGIQVSAGTTMLALICQESSGILSVNTIAQVFGNPPGTVLHRLLTVGDAIDLSFEYDPSTETLSASATLDGITYTASQSFATTGAVNVALVAFSEQKQIAVPSRAVLGFDFVRSNLDVQRYIATLAPFEDSGMAYDGAINQNPGTIFLSSLGIKEIATDGTQLGADGVLSFNVALVTSAPGVFPSGTRHTLITELSQAALSTIPVFESVDAFIPNVYVAQGFGNDYLINLAPDACSEVANALASLQLSIDSVSGLGNSLQAKLNQIVSAFQSGDYAGATSQVGALRNQVEAQGGKKIPVVTSSAMTVLLDQMEASLQQLVTDNLVCL